MKITEAVRIVRLGERVRERRVVIGWTQTELAHKMGYISKVSVSRIERGKHGPSLATLLRLCRVLGVTPNDLLL